MRSSSLPPLLVLTDRRQLPPGRTLADAVEAGAGAGLELVVLRELDLPAAERERLCAELSAHVRVVSARAPLGAACGLHLHATQSGLVARGLPLHGRSCHDPEDVWRAAASGADYVTLSPVAPSRSKPGYGPPLAPDALRRAARAARAGGRTSVFALGGVDAGNAAALRGAGADGVAVMGAVMRARDPAAVVGRLLEAVR